VVPEVGDAVVEFDSIEQAVICASLNPEEIDASADRNALDTRARSRPIGERLLGMRALPSSSKASSRSAAQA
jgi:hypothetical protein